MPEIIADGITGFLVHDAEEMVAAVAKVKQLDRFRCRQWVEERFSSDRMVLGYLRVYEKIIGRSKNDDGKI
jgi:glycosyltransferase involved in cell wall biosynthesis